MARKGLILSNQRKMDLFHRFKEKRQMLKAQLMNKSNRFEDRFQASQALAALPRNSAIVRYQRRCRVNGRPHAVYRQFGLCRNVLRDLAAQGQIPGVLRSSW